MCGTATGEAYTFYFMHLADVFKLEFAKKFPESNPTTMDEVYEFARTIDMAQQWQRGSKRSPDTNSSI